MNMPTFEIEQYELHIMKYRVDANSKAEAIKRVLDGEAEPVGESQEYVEVAEDFGLPVDECRELASELEALEISVGKHVIPSIRSVEEIESK
jgi:hypothetical protein